MSGCGVEPSEAPDPARAGGAHCPDKAGAEPEAGRSLPGEVTNLRGEHRLSPNGIVLAKPMERGSESGVGRKARQHAGNNIALNQRELDDSPKKYPYISLL